MENLALSVLYNSFWIVGLALLLAAFSYHYDRAQRSDRPLRTQLGARSFVIVAWTSMLLVSIGLAATSTRWWETIIWSAFAIVSAVNAIGAQRLKRDSSMEPPSSENSK